MRIPLGGGFAGRIATERAPIVIPDVNDADVLNPILRKAGVRSLLGVPMIVEGRIVGVLHVGTLSPRDFTEEDAALLQLAASRPARPSSASVCTTRSIASTATPSHCSAACFRRAPRR